MRGLPEVYKPREDHCEAKIACEGDVATIYCPKCKRNMCDLCCECH